MSEPGAHPEDHTLFAPPALPRLRRGAEDLSWLLGRGYPVDSALRLVGDRHQLEARQRMALRRVSCSDEARLQRQRARRGPGGAGDQVLWVDGYNLLITFATALRGGLLLVGRDRVLRDLASSHRLVLRTAEMLGPVAAALAAAPPREVRWVLDRPVSNSDRVGQMICAFAEEHGLPWSYRLEYDPDAFLIEQGEPVVTSDAMILDAGIAWVDLLTPLVGALPGRWVVDLFGALQPPGANEVG